MNRARAKELLDYNPETGVFKWLVDNGCRVHKGDIAGATCAVGLGKKKYRYIKYQGVNYRAHRLAYLMMMGASPKEQIDHINGDGLDNRWVNLRSATHSENQRNVKKRIDNTSGVTGVYFNKTNKTWFVKIGVGTELKYVGSYKEFWDAVCARKSAEWQHNYHRNHGVERKA